jgi:hypothetical protein
MKKTSYLRLAKQQTSAEVEQQRLDLELMEAKLAGPQRVTSLKKSDLCF